ncbi:MAG: hypothetical protein AAF890_05985, partial [Pseudomonadota bacterium]
PILCIGALTLTIGAGFKIDLAVKWGAARDQCSSDRFCHWFLLGSAAVQNPLGVLIWYAFALADPPAIQF